MCAKWTISVANGYNRCIDDQRQASTAIFLVPALNILAPNSGTNIYKIAADDLTNKVMLRGRVIQ